MSAAQSRRLFKWLHIEQLSYGEAGKLLWDQFGIQANPGHLHRFYQRNCKSRPAAPYRHGKTVLLDLRIYPRGTGWQFLILHRAPGLVPSSMAARSSPRTECEPNHNPK